MQFCNPGDPKGGGAVGNRFVIYRCVCKIEPPVKDAVLMSRARRVRLQWSHGLVVLASRSVFILVIFVLRLAH